MPPLSYRSPCVSTSFKHASIFLRQNLAHFSNSSSVLWFKKGNTANNEHTAGHKPNCFRNGSLVTDWMHMFAFAILAVPESHITLWPISSYQYTRHLVLGCVPSERNNYRFGVEDEISWLCFADIGQVALAGLTKLADLIYQSNANNAAYV